MAYKILTTKSFEKDFKRCMKRGFKKITEEFERANLPLPTIERMVVV